MNQLEPTPQEITDYNQALVTSLQALQNVGAEQRQQILALTVEIIEALSKLSHEESSHSVQASIDELKKKVEATLAATPLIVKTTPQPGSPEWLTHLLDALSQAQENAVSAQQQLNVTAVAVLTEGIATLLSAAGSSKAKA